MVCRRCLSIDIVAFIIVTNIQFLSQRAMSDDEKYMRRALQLAVHGRDFTTPNPMVGAVIVAYGRIIGEGWHRRYGEAHAEVNAVRSVAELDRRLLPQATIYVTLEPCSHYGKTPPCAKLLIDTDFRRVVVGTLDPFPEVAGKGVAMLREAGIEVTVGVLEEKCKLLNSRFIWAHTHSEPFVLLKWAQTADGFIAKPDGTPLQISTELTSVMMHRERAAIDAIIVGAATAVADNPSLTVRHWPARRQPLRVLVAPHTALPTALKLLSDGLPTLIYTLRSNIPSSTPTAVEWAEIEPHDAADALPSVLRDLHRRGISSVMVEGGAATLRSLIDGGLWQEARIETSPTLAGTGIAAPRLHNIASTKTATIDGNSISTVTNKD